MLLTSFNFRGRECERKVLINLGFVERNSLKLGKSGVDKVLFLPLLKSAIADLHRIAVLNHNWLG